MRHDVLAAVVRALQTRVDHRVPIALRQPVHPPATMQRGIVHQHVDLSKALQNLDDHALHVRRDCDIGLHWQAVSAQGTDGLLHRYGRIETADVVNRHMGALGG